MSSSSSRPRSSRSASNGKFRATTTATRASPSRYRKKGSAKWSRGARSTARAERRDLHARRARLHRAEHVRRQPVRSRRRHRVRSEAHAAGSGRRQRRRGEDASPSARAPSRSPAAERPRVPRVPARLHGREAAARVLRPARGVLHGLTRRRLEPRIAAARASGRHHSRARGRVPQQARSLLARDQFALHHVLWHAVGRHVLPHAGRHAGQAHRDRRRGRRRSDLRRRRQHRAVQPDGRRLQLLRRHHLPQHRHGHRGRA